MQLVTAIPEESAASGSTDAELVASALEGNVLAMEALYRRYANRANGLAFRLLGRAEDLDDVVQEAFTGVFSSLRRLKNRELFWPFLAAVLVRTTHKLLRRRRLLAKLGLREDEPPDLDALVSSHAPPDVVAEVRQIYACVERLPVALRTPLILRRIEGMSLEEVAEHVGVSLATVKRRLAEAEQLLVLSVGER